VWRRSRVTLVTLAPALLARAAHAEEAGGLDAGDTAWVLTSSALVLMMTLPGLALFYGGLVRGKNVLSVLMQCMASAGWPVSPGSWPATASPSPRAMLRRRPHQARAGRRGAGCLEGTIPELRLRDAFQGMFAIITPALMLGAFAERMRFTAYLVFITIWLLLVYVPLAHMVWGGGWIGRSLGALDFAGGWSCTCRAASRRWSRRSSSASAAASARADAAAQPALHVIGASLLWVGWFGFNAGSALAATAPRPGLPQHPHRHGGGLLGWLVIEWLHRGKPTVLGAATGAVAGLVAITPACAFVSRGARSWSASAPRRSATWRSRC
jgi:ammonium transporter, Amt family